MRIIAADRPEHMIETGQLFREYEAFLNVDLCFQAFETELSTLPGKYAPPEGALLLAVDESQAAGCVAVKPLDKKICEMKRLFVRPQYRGSGLGKKLAERIISEAEGMGYRLMRLDTLDRLTEAMGLYQSLGFRRINAYYNNPLPDVVYWEKTLGEE